MASCIFAGIGHYECELVAAHPCHCICLAQHFLHGSGDAHQHPIAYSMPPLVVDLLEAAQVEVCERDRLAKALCAIHLCSDDLMESEPIADAGEIVYARKLPLHVVEGFQLGDDYRQEDEESQPDQRIPVRDARMKQVRWRSE